ncbi:MAG TPA: hypothetical protein DHV39_11835, partial [Verrucomicrobiales bacterium]|nr:hypothetical protein [Verrucomicrobiales bacterium]
MNTNPRSENSPNRRTFMAQLGALLGSAAVGPDLNAQTASNPFTVPVPTSSNRPIYNSDVGSMWPLIQNQAKRAYFPYSFTRDNY